MFHKIWRCLQKIKIWNFEKGERGGQPYFLITYQKKTIYFMYFWIIVHKWSTNTEVPGPGATDAEAILNLNFLRRKT
jgi:hypothetical protein